jgi:superfamily II DNA or RNA helicase
MILRDYQQELLDKILSNNHRKICTQLATGGGKTVIFSSLAEQLNGRTLILVNSIDLLNQTKKTIKRIGLDVGIIISGTQFMPTNKIVVGMVESVHRRKERLPYFDNCIIDECHIGTFDKMVDFLTETKIFGFTATPVRLGKNSVLEGDDEYVEKRVLNDVYEDIIVGIPIADLIKQGHLIEELTVNAYDGEALKMLKTDSSGEFTNDSLELAYLSDEFKQVLLHTLQKYCKGQKTMLFTISREANDQYFELLKDNFNCKVYDSSDEYKGTRNEVVEWFRNEREAILINTGCFTTGFDVCDVENIVVARATGSLSLWIQIAGRGARPTKKIDKKRFHIYDMGTNQERLGSFSQPFDWKKIFSDKERKIKNPLYCDVCGTELVKGETECTSCGTPKSKAKSTKDERKTVLEFYFDGIIDKEAEFKNYDIEKINVSKYEVYKGLINKSVMYILKRGTTLKNTTHPDFESRIYNLIKEDYNNINFSQLENSRHLKIETIINKIAENVCKQLNSQNTEM